MHRCFGFFCPGTNVTKIRVSAPAPYKNPTVILRGMKKIQGQPTCILWMSVLGHALLEISGTSYMFGQIVGYNRAGLKGGDNGEGVVAIVCQSSPPRWKTPTFNSTRQSLASTLSVLAVVATFALSSRSPRKFGYPLFAYSLFKPNSHDTIVYFGKTQSSSKPPPGPSQYTPNLEQAYCPWTEVSFWIGTLQKSLLRPQSHSNSRSYRKSGIAPKAPRKTLCILHNSPNFPNFPEFPQIPWSFWKIRGERNSRNRVFWMRSSSRNSLFSRSRIADGMSQRKSACERLSVLVSSSPHFSDLLVMMKVISSPQR